MTSTQIPEDKETRRFRIAAEARERFNKKADEDSRAAFEAMVRLECKMPDFVFLRDDTAPDEYDDVYIEHEWHGWKEALKWRAGND